MDVSQANHPTKSTLLAGLEVLFELALYYCTMKKSWPVSQRNMFQAV